MAETVRPIVPLKSEFAGDPDMAELVEEFVAQLPLRVNDVVNAFTGRKRADLKRIAHQLKGAGGGYGFPTITHAADKVEARLLVAGIPDEAAIRGVESEIRSLVDLCMRAAASGKTPPSEIPRF